MEESLQERKWWWNNFDLLKVDEHRLSRSKEHFLLTGGSEVRHGICPRVRRVPKLRISRNILFGEDYRYVSVSSLTIVFKPVWPPKGKKIGAEKNRLANWSAGTDRFSFTWRVSTSLGSNKINYDHGPLSRRYNSSYPTFFWRCLNRLWIEANPSTCFWTRHFLKHE